MAKKNNTKNIVEKLVKLLVNIVVVFICIIAFLLLYYIISAQIHSNDENYKPRISLYTIVSPSMDPIIKVYDVVVNVKVKFPQNIQVGDIITYKSTNSTSEGMTITHRVIEVLSTTEGNYEYKTQGDNNSEPDSTYVTFDNVIGKEVFIIPSLGKIQFLLANKKGWLFILLIPVAIYIFRDLYKLIELFGLRRKVDKVAGFVEEPTYVKKKNEKERKEQIKRKLKSIEAKYDSKERNENETFGFLIPYSETLITVGNLTYTKLDDETKILDSKKEESPKLSSLEIAKAEVKKEENNKIEILDTDELTTVIKDYTEKIAKLEEVIADLEDNTKKQKVQEKVIEEETIDEYNYLKDGKIKVVSVEVAKKARNKNLEAVKKNEKPSVKIEQIELKSLYTKPMKKNQTVERPDSIDIKSINSTNKNLDIELTMLNKNDGKKKLNLKSTKIDKVKKKSIRNNDLNLKKTKNKKIVYIEKVNKKSA